MNPEGEQILGLALELQLSKLLTLANELLLINPADKTKLLW